VELSGEGVQVTTGLAPIWRENKHEHVMRSVSFSGRRKDHPHGFREAEDLPRARIKRPLLTDTVR
jgi:hypothetical protein